MLGVSLYIKKTVKTYRNAGGVRRAGPPNSCGYLKSKKNDK